jgi:type 2 lantibiotic biosynthesis protein LanM
LRRNETLRIVALDPSYGLIIFMNKFFERLVIRAATIDEILSDDFEPLKGEQSGADLAGRRLAAWCRSCASGDWSMFSNRLKRDNLSITDVLSRFASVRRKPNIPFPVWINDAVWIDGAMHDHIPGIDCSEDTCRDGPLPFQSLYIQLVARAEEILWSCVDVKLSGRFSKSARRDLRFALFKSLSNLCAPALYERFAFMRRKTGPSFSSISEKCSENSLYRSFIAEMSGGGLREMFEDKPILLRLIATTTRQWIDSNQEFILRFGADLQAIRRCEFLSANTTLMVDGIQGDLSDPHNDGRSVKLVRFSDGSRIVYKPKDLGADAAWFSLVTLVNETGGPVQLRSARVIARSGYGWAEFIDHAGCADLEDVKLFFRRAGAWLALFYTVLGRDVHQENLIASGSHPVPIDLETLFQNTIAEHRSQENEAQAFEAAVDVVSESVGMTGLLPSYIKSRDGEIFVSGGLAAGSQGTKKLAWEDINSDRMRPTQKTQTEQANPNLPHIDGRYEQLDSHLDDLVAGFRSYARFISAKIDILERFRGVVVRKIIRPTRFYYMLLQRLNDYRTMADGIIWSAQADFLARLSDWDDDLASLWSLQKLERSALLTLNVPHFVSRCDRDEFVDRTGARVAVGAVSGLDRARDRLQRVDEHEIAWQVSVIEHNTRSLSRSEASQDKSSFLPLTDTVPPREFFVAEANAIADDLIEQAVRRGPSAAWIGLDWLGDSDVSQLVALGPDLYNGTSGIAVFLAAHAAVTGRGDSKELALAAVAHVRKSLKSRNAARMVRALGIGGATGLGSIIYAFAILSRFLGDSGLLMDAHAAVELLDDDLIASDKQLDVVGGCAGAILALLRLHRDSRSVLALERAARCGDHLLAQPRHQTTRGRSWAGQGVGSQPLNGMSHGAAGYSYALMSLASATGRNDFADASRECLAYENASYDDERSNWPDLRNGGSSFACQWCHGAAGIGLARIAAGKHGVRKTDTDSELLWKLQIDIRRALAGAENCLTGQVDTLCCGGLGNVEFFREAHQALGRSDLDDIAARRLTAILQAKASAGDYRWNAGERRFNPGLFRGLAGVGYTCLRQADPNLPNILIWD